MIAAGVLALSALFVIPATASADSYRRTIGKCNACGSTLYANRVFVGYNHYRQPVYRYVPVAHSCKKSSHRGYSDRHRGHEYRGREYREDQEERSRKYRKYQEERSERGRHEYRHRGHDHRGYGERRGASIWFRFGG